MMKIHQKVEETCKECEGMPAMLDVFDTLTQFENDDDTEELVMDLASASSSPFKFGQNYQTMVMFKNVALYNICNFTTNARVPN